MEQKFKEMEIFDNFLRQNLIKIHTKTHHFQKFLWGTYPRTSQLYDLQIFISEKKFLPPPLPPPPLPNIGYAPADSW